MRDVCRLTQPEQCQQLVADRGSAYLSYQRQLTDSTLHKVPTSRQQGRVLLHAQLYLHAVVQCRSRSNNRSKFGATGGR